MNCSTCNNCFIFSGPKQDSYFTISNKNVVFIMCSEGHWKKQTTMVEEHYVYPHLGYLNALRNSMNNAAGIHSHQLGTSNSSQLNGLQQQMQHISAHKSALNQQVAQQSVGTDKSQTNINRVFGWWK